MNAIQLYIRFIVKSTELTKKGFAPVRCRLTYNKNRKDFSTGITVNPDYWDPKKQRLLDQSDQEGLSCGDQYLRRWWCYSLIMLIERLVIRAVAD